MVVLFLGNSSPWKGADVLLRAFARVRSEIPEALLLTAWGKAYAWNGNRREHLLALIKSLGLHPAVRQFGIVPDIRTLTRVADVLASPFRRSFQVLDYLLSILEAMACEPPVVSTRVGGVREILGAKGDGLLVPPGDDAPLAQAIAGLPSDPERPTAIGIRGGRWARETSGETSAVHGIERAVERPYAILDRARSRPHAHRVPSPN